MFDVSIFSEYCSNFDTFGSNPNSQFCCDIKVTRKYDPCHNEVTIWRNSQTISGQFRPKIPTKNIFQHQNIKICTFEPKVFLNLARKMNL